MLILSYSATAQSLPNDRERDGLKGRVHIVEEKNIGTKYQNDTTHRRGVYYVNVPDSHRVLLFFKKVGEKRVKRDTIFVDQTPKQVSDTHYYSRTEYTPEGYLKSQIVVQKGVRGHVQTVTTFSNNLKLEMRSYCKETGITTQWHYYYSDYSKDAQLEQVIVTRYQGHESGKMIERIEFEYINESEICFERHVSHAGVTLKTLKYESDVLTDMACGRDTNMHYIYDAEGRLVEAEVYNTDYELIRTDKYEYNPAGVRLTRVPDTKNSGRQILPEIITYDEEYDGAGNWTRRTTNGKETRNREIKYYNR